MSDIKLPKMPGKHYRALQKELDELFHKFLKIDFINNRTNLNIDLFLKILNLVSLDEFEEKLRKRDGGLIKFESGKIGENINFSNNHNTRTIQKIDKPLPIIGRFKISIGKKLNLEIKSTQDSFLLLFGDSIELDFKNPNLDIGIRKQVLKSIKVTKDSFVYNFTNVNINKPNLIFEIDLNLKEDQTYLKEKSKLTLGEKASKFICTDKCFCGGSGTGGDTPTTETRIASIHVTRINPGIGYLVFNVPYDNAEIALSFHTFSGNFKINKFYTNKADVFGVTEWPYDTRGGKFNKHYTRFNKGRYIFRIERGEPFPPDYFWNMEAFIVE